MRDEDRPIPLEIGPVGSSGPVATDELRKARAPSALAVIDGQLSTHTRLILRQRKDWGEIFTGWEKANRYEVHDASGAVLLHAFEVSTGGWSVLSRVLLRAQRPFRMEVTRGDGSPVVTLVRPWRFWLSRLEVVGPDARPLGRVEQRFSFVRRIYQVFDDQGRTLFEVVGPLLRPWTFLFLQAGQEVGSTSKKWRGLGIEAFTDADTYVIEWSAARLRPGSHLLAVAATILIDFVHFEWRGS